MAQTRELEGIAQEVAAALPARLLHHCRVASRRGTQLVLQVDSPAWATRLRYQVPALLEHLQAHGWPGLTQARVRVRVGQPEPVPPPAQRAVMSRESAELLRTVAEDCSDPDLRAAWGRLARHGSRPPDKL